MKKKRAKKKADVKGQLWQDFARFGCDVGCRAVDGAIAGGLLLGQRTGGPHTKTEDRFAQVGRCLRTAQEMRTLFDKSIKVVNSRMMLQKV